jgi:hypothetical protein
MICVRLSEEEYSALRRLCVVAGARSVSELARDAMRMLLNGANREDAPESSMEEFCAQLKSMDRKIEQLTAQIAMAGMKNHP